VAKSSNSLRNSRRLAVSPLKEGALLELGLGIVPMPLLVLNMERELLDKGGICTGSEGRVSRGNDLADAELGGARHSEMAESGEVRWSNVCLSFRRQQIGEGTVLSEVSFEFEAEALVAARVA
jgi:hypothetical protein